MTPSCPRCGGVLPCAVCVGKWPIILLVFFLFLPTTTLCARITASSGVRFFSSTSLPTPLASPRTHNRKPAACAQWSAGNAGERGRANHSHKMAIVHPQTKIANTLATATTIHWPRLSSVVEFILF